MFFVVALLLRFEIQLQLPRNVPEAILVKKLDAMSINNLIDCLNDKKTFDNKDQFNRKNKN